MSVPILREPNSVMLLAALEEAGAVIDNGLRLPPDLDYSRYEALGVMLGVLHHMNSWLLGDWLLYGEHTYGEKYAQAASLTGLSPQTCANYASIAKRVPPSRRRALVSFSCHAEVASLEPAEQKRWLEIAEEEDLRKEELRIRIRAERNGEVDLLPALSALSVEEAARALCAVARPHVGGAYIVPGEPLQALREALDA